MVDVAVHFSEKFGMADFMKCFTCVKSWDKYCADIPGICELKIRVKQFIPWIIKFIIKFTELHKIYVA